METKNTVTKWEQINCKIVYFSQNNTIVGFEIKNKVNEIIQKSN